MKADTIREFTIETGDRCISLTGETANGIYFMVGLWFGADGSATRGNVQLRNGAEVVVELRGPFSDQPLGPKANGRKDIWVFEPPAGAPSYYISIDTIKCWMGMNPVVFEAEYVAIPLPGWETRISKSQLANIPERRAMDREIDQILATIGNFRQAQKGRRPRGHSEKTLQDYRKIAEAYYKGRQSQAEFCATWRISRAKLARALAWATSAKVSTYRPPTD